VSHRRRGGAGRWSRRRWPLRVVVLVVCTLFAFACRQKQKAGGQDAPTSATPVLTDTTPDVLLTWIDDSGDFHVTEKIADIKDANREHVRVVFTTRDTVDPDHVFVADLRHKDDKGDYAVRSMARSAWEELGASHRKERMEALSAPPTPAPDAGIAELVAVIYGADWCKACHETAQYLSSKGIRYVEKDVDKSSVIQAELQAKFARAHVPPTSSIPVTDINGRLIVGFNPQALDSAVAAARGSRTL
jgi:glutaredoxin